MFSSLASLSLARSRQERGVKEDHHPGGSNPWCPDGLITGSHDVLKVKEGREG
jgi:hypothetical protein